MSDRPGLHQELLSCTQRAVDEINQSNPQVSTVMELFARRTELFTQLSDTAQDTDTTELRALAAMLRPLDTQLLDWMQAHHQEIARSLTKARKKASAPQQGAPHILIQSA